jgi:hypothetical protein
LEFCLQWQLQLSTEDRSVLAFSSVAAQCLQPLGWAFVVVREQHDLA